MKKIRLNYELIYNVNKIEECSLYDVWNIFDIPVRYETFERRVHDYNRTGHAAELCVTRDYKTLGNNVWTMFETRTKSKKKWQPRYIGERDAIDCDCDFEQISIDDTLEPACMSSQDIVAGLTKGIKREAISEVPQLREDAIEHLRDIGYNIMFDPSTDEYRFATYIPPAEPIIKNCVDKHFKIGVVSDTHIGSKHSDLDFLHELYDAFESLGVKDVYHCGDICDGMYSNRSDQVYELNDIGVDAQVSRVVDAYPIREGMTTYFITGNHDHTFIRNTGYNIGPAIDRRREDLVYLGHMNAKVYLTPNCVMELNHPGDGSAYALSYSIQKMCDSYSGGDKPNILLNGHHHKFMQMFYRNIHAFEVPSTQLQTPFMKSKRLAAHVGGLVLDIYVDGEGTITRIGCELIPRY